MENKTFIHQGIDISVKWFIGDYVYRWSFDYVNDAGFEVRRTFEQPTLEEAIEEAKYEIDLVTSSEQIKVLN